MNIYLVIKADGTLKRTGGHTTAYTTAGRAQSHARNDGDSVVEVEVDLDKEPLYIHRKVVK